MSGNDSGLLTAIVILIFFSALFSAIETAYSSASKIRLKNMANNKEKGAADALKIIENFDQFLTTVLIGNNIVNITMATLGTVLFTHIYGDTGATISTAVITVIVLIFGEVTPKSIAKQAPERFASKTAGFVRFFEIIFIPLNLIFKGWQLLVSKVIHLQPEDSDISDELITMVDEAEKEGDLEAHESDLISAAIEFNDEDVQDVLTPRVDVVAVDLGTSLEHVERVFRLNSYSRLPVYENSVDNIVGVIHEKDFYNLYYQDKDRSRGMLRKIIKPVIYTSENTKISALLKQLQAAKLHLAVVLDEYGGTQGIITMEDIIEELVGEIADEHDVPSHEFRLLAPGEALVDGKLRLEDINERMCTTLPEGQYETVGGLVSGLAGHIPSSGESFEVEDTRLVVEESDGQHVERIRIVVGPREGDD